MHIDGENIARADPAIGSVTEPLAAKDFVDPPPDRSRLVITISFERIGPIPRGRFGLPPVILDKLPGQHNRYPSGYPH